MPENRLPAEFYHRLMLGTKTKSLGELKFKTHSEYGMLATIIITRSAGKWFVSFSYERALAVVSEEELIAYYGAMTETQLDKIALGMDRGVVIPVATSIKGSTYDLTENADHNRPWEVNSSREMGMLILPPKRQKMKKS